VKKLDISEEGQKLSFNPLQGVDNEEAKGEGGLTTYIGENKETEVRSPIGQCSGESPV